jgi:hypothetical protein
LWGSNTRTGGGPLQGSVHPLPLSGCTQAPRPSVMTRYAQADDVVGPVAVLWSLMAGEAAARARRRPGSRQCWRCRSRRANGAVASCRWALLRPAQRAGLVPGLSCRVCSLTVATMRWMSSDGKWVVTLVRLTGTGNGRDGGWLRVSHRGFFVGEARDWDEVARLGVDIGDLRECLRIAVRASFRWFCSRFHFGASAASSGSAGDASAMWHCGCC